MTPRRATLLAGVAMLVAVGAGLNLGDGAPTVVVQPGASVSEALEANPSAEIVLAAGEHPGFMLDRRATVRGAEGAVVRGPIVVTADRAVLVGVHVRGGNSGISVQDAREVLLENVRVEGATWHGVEVVQGTATITGCHVGGLVHELAQGIEVRNSNGFGRTRISGCAVTGGQEGIVSHVSRLEIRDNVVRDTTMRAIAVTEMSEGLVERNTVDGAMGTGLFCGDMSHCELRDNVVRNVRADPAGIRSRSGQAVVAWHYSTMRLSGNTFERTALPAVGVYDGSITTDRFPLSHWPAGWRGALPALGVTAIALVALATCRLLVGPLARRVGDRWRSRPTAPGVARLGVHALVVTAVSQGFHVVEHAAQVWQVYVADAEIQSGLVGAAVDTEWLHLGFNAMVLTGALVAMGLARHELAARHRVVLPWLLAGVAVQTWHVAEHVARMFQYLDTGVSPAPGIIGARLGLVWFHFGINIPITVVLGVAGWSLLRPAWRRVRVGATSPGPAPATA